MKVFVYGTLRPMARNHALLRTLGATFVAKGTVRGTLYMNNDLPMMSSEPAKVRGEIFEIEEKHINVLDEFEGHPHWYKRDMTEVTTDDGLKIPAFAYWMPLPRLWSSRGVTITVASGDYLAWKDRKKEHNDVRN